MVASRIHVRSCFTFATGPREGAGFVGNSGYSRPTRARDETRPIWRRAGPKVVDLRAPQSRFGPVFRLPTLVKAGAANGETRRTKVSSSPRDPLTDRAPGGIRTWSFGPAPKPTKVEPYVPEQQGPLMHFITEPTKRPVRAVRARNTGRTPRRPCNARTGGSRRGRTSAPARGDPDDGDPEPAGLAPRPSRRSRHGGLSARLGARGPQETQGCPRRPVGRDSADGNAQTAIYRVVG